MILHLFTFQLDVAFTIIPDGCYARKSPLFFLSQPVLILTVGLEIELSFYPVCATESRITNGAIFFSLPCFFLSVWSSFWVCMWVRHLGQIRPWKIKTHCQWLVNILRKGKITCERPPVWHRKNKRPYVKTSYDCYNRATYTALAALSLILEKNASIKHCLQLKNTTFMFYKLFSRTNFIFSFFSLLAQWLLLVFPMSLQQQHLFWRLNGFFISGDHCIVAGLYCGVSGYACKYEAKLTEEEEEEAAQTETEESDDAAIDDDSVFSMRNFKEEEEKRRQEFMKFVFGQWNCS